MQQGRQEEQHEGIDPEDQEALSREALANGYHEVWRYLAEVPGATGRWASEQWQANDDELDVPWEGVAA